MFVIRKKIAILSSMAVLAVLICIAVGIFFIIQVLDAEEEFGGPEICLKSQCMPPGLFKRSATSYVCSPEKCLVLSRNATETDDICVAKECITRGDPEQYNTTNICLETMCFDASLVPHLNPGLCLSADCIHAADQVLKSMDKSLKPCDDFYSFSCRGFFAKEIIPDGQMFYSANHKELEKAFLSVKKILDEPITANDSDAMQKTKSVYRMCLNEDALKSANASFIAAVIKNHGIGDWHVVETKESQCSVDIEWRTALLHVYGVETFFHFDVDFAEDSSAFIRMSIADPLIFSGSCTDGSPSVRLKLQAYNNMLTKLQGIFLKFAPWSIKRESKRYVDEIIDFDQQLCMAMQKDDVQGSDVYRHDITLEELASFTNQFNFKRWHNIITSEFDLDSRIKNAPFEVYDVHFYINNITELLRRTPARIINNYLSTKFMMAYAGFLGEEFLKIVTAFSSLFKDHMKYTMYPVSFLPRWKQCQKYVQKAMGMALVPSVVSEIITQPVEREMRYLSELLKFAFKETFHHSRYLNHQVKKDVLKKISHFDAILLYAQQNESFYDEYYSDVESLGNSFFENGLKLGFFHQKKIFEAVYSGVNNSEMELQVLLHGPFDNNAVSQVTENKTVVYLGTPQVIGVNPNVPRYMNFATLGTALAREFAVSSHLLSDRPGNDIYDRKAKKWKPWSEDLREHVKEQTQCYIDRYSNEKQDFEAKEIMADVQALRESMQAYRMYYGKYGHEPLPPNVNNSYDDEQLFFIMHVQPLCTMEISSNPKQKYGTPDLVRINEVLRNLDDFADAFRCPSNSPMNPRDKCGTIW